MKRRSKAVGKADKAGRRKAATLKRAIPPKAVLSRRSATTAQETETARLTRERDEALERENATAEILRVVSSSAGQLEPVFQAMLANAVRICEAKFGTLSSGGRRLPSRCATQRAACIRRVLATRITSAGSEHSP